MKKRLASLCFLLLCAVWAGLALPSRAAAEKKPLVLAVLPAPSGETPAEGGASERVDCWYRTGSTRYFFLPSHFDPERLVLLIEGAESLRIGGREYRSGDLISLPLNDKVEVRGSGSPFTLITMQSAHLPAVFIETESGTMDEVHREKGVKEAGLMTMTEADGAVAYRGALKYIRGRGNSTFDYPKKPYQIKLGSGAALCGGNSGKTFILLANFLDRSCIRNTLALDLVRYSGAYAFTPACRAVDLYLNHVYAGSYLLTEKCEIGKKRLNIVNLEEQTEAMNEQPLESFPFVGNKRYRVGATRAYQIPQEPEDVTGGYLILANNTEYFQTEASGFVTKRGQAFTMQQPKYASERQLAYIGGVMQEIENGLFAADGRDPATGRHFSELLDMTSFVHRYLQSEVTNDFDGERPYFYKDSDAVDGTVYCGPVWDQDNILGASSRRANADYVSLENDDRRSYYWFPQAMKHPEFREAMIETYHRVYRPACRILLGEAEDPDGVLRSVDAYMEEVARSLEMDHVRWIKSLWAQKSGGNTRIGDTPASCAAFLKNFIRTHMEVLDKAYPQPAP